MDVQIARHLVRQFAQEGSEAIAICMGCPFDISQKPLMVHFVDESFRIHSLGLSSAHFPGTHCAVDVKPKLMEVLVDFGINDEHDVACGVRLVV